MPYVNFISQTMDITKPQEVRLSIYPVFHFCPGTADEVHGLSPKRKDGRINPLATIPNNSNAKAMLGSDYTKHKEDQWFDDAVEKVPIGQTVGTAETKYEYFWKKDKDYTDRDWLKFQQAVKEHHKVAEAVFQSAGLAIPGYDVEKSLPAADLQ